MTSPFFTFCVQRVSRRSRQKREVKLAVQRHDNDSINLAIPIFPLFWRSSASAVPENVLYKTGRISGPAPRRRTWRWTIANGFQINVLGVQPRRNIDSRSLDFPLLFSTATRRLSSSTFSWKHALDIHFACPPVEAKSFMWKLLWFGSICEWFFWHDALIAKPHPSGLLMTSSWRALNGKGSWDEVFADVEGWPGIPGVIHATCNFLISRLSFWMDGASCRYLNIFVLWEEWKKRKEREQSSRSARIWVPFSVNQNIGNFANGNTKLETSAVNTMLV